MLVASYVNDFGHRIRIRKSGNLGWTFEEIFELSVRLQALQEIFRSIRRDEMIPNYLLLRH